MKLMSFIILFILILVGCEAQEVQEEVQEEVLEVTVPSVSSTPIVSPNLDVNDEWNTYNNGRYGFSIKYPQKWTVADESENGDGKALYIGNPEVDIRVYASHFSSVYEKEDHMQFQSIKLDNGFVATMSVGYLDDIYFLNLKYVSSEEIEYTYYVKVSKEFFKENEESLLKVAKTFDMPE